MTPYYSTESGKLYNGDCLKILQTCGLADALITDPPFAFTGGISNGMSSNASDQFFRLWWDVFCKTIVTVLKPTASGFIWCDWRTAKLIAEGFEPKQQTYNFFRIAQMIYHYREMPGQGQPFRSSIDMIAYLRGPKHKNKSIAATTHNFVSEYWYYGKHEHHPSEKSVSMCERFLKWCSKENDIVIDPFMGSGTTAIACERLNRRWIGIDLTN